MIIKHLSGLMVLEDWSPLLQRDGTVAGTSESSHLEHTGWSERMHWE